MRPSPAVIVEEELAIPAGTSELSRFRQWSWGSGFPERGRIDFLAGTVEVDLSPEDLYTHGAVKSALAARLYTLVVDANRGDLYIDRTRIVSPGAKLSVEPDLVVALWESLRAGRIREVPAASGEEGRFIELEGAPDLVVEIVSDSSAGKDRVRLPRLYAAAGIPELWLVDARGEDLAFDLFVLRAGRYVRQSPGAEGWLLSPVLQRTVRLTRRLNERARWTYELEHR
jgi:Uma2 family endonuclease